MFVVKQQLIHKPKIQLGLDLCKYLHLNKCSLEFANHSWYDNSIKLQTNLSAVVILIIIDVEKIAIVFIIAFNTITVNQKNIIDNKIEVYTIDECFYLVLNPILSVG